MTNALWSVTELNQKAKQLLESNMSFVWVQGEVSNLTRPNSGHLYFTIKDNFAQVSCIWLKYQQSPNIKHLANGKQWWFKGKLSIYQERGNFQLIVNYAEEFGLGEKQRLFEQKKQALKAIGWLEPIHKKPIPVFAKEIALVTSVSGAAVRDMIKVIRRRMPATKVLVVACQVQGQNSAMSIASAIEIANSHSNADLIIVGRGGGNIEDLWAYNEDPVINAIFYSNKPIITGIGHEVDNTLADLVADVRAATPSAAAETATSELNQVSQKLDFYCSELNKQIDRINTTKKMQLQTLQAKCHDPTKLLKIKSGEIISYKIYLQNLIKAKHSIAENKLANIKITTPDLEKNLTRLKHQQITINDMILNHLEKKSLKTYGITNQLRTLNPLFLLAKGYSIVRNNSGEILTKDNIVKVGDIITIETSKFHYKAKIEEKI